MVYCWDCHLKVYVFVTDRFQRIVGLEMEEYFHFRCLNELLPSRKYKTCWICFWPLWASMGLHSLALLKRPKNMCIYIYTYYIHTWTYVKTLHYIASHCITSDHMNHLTTRRDTSRHVRSHHVTSNHIYIYIYIYVCVCA